MTFKEQLTNYRRLSRRRIAQLERKLREGKITRRELLRELELVASARPSPFLV